MIELMRRVRGDAKLEQLNPEQKKQLVAWLEDEHQTYVKIAAKVKETFGVSVGRSAVGCYWRRHIMPRQIVREIFSPEALEELAQETVEEVAVKLAARQAMVLLDEASDLRTAALLLREVHNAKRLQLARERDARAARKDARVEQAAAAAAAEQAKAKTEEEEKRRKAAEPLSEEERERRLRAIFGMKPVPPVPPLLPGSPGYYRYVKTEGPVPLVPESEAFNEEGKPRKRRPEEVPPNEAPHPCRLDFVGMTNVEHRAAYWKAFNKWHAARLAEERFPYEPPYDGLENCTLTSVRL